MAETDTKNPIPRDIFEPSQVKAYETEAEFLVALGGMLQEAGHFFDFREVTISVYPYYTADWYYRDLNPSVVFHVNNKEELINLRNILGGGAKCFDSRNEKFASPMIAGVYPDTGILWAIKRTDLQCEYVPTGEYEEVEETVVVQEAVTETVVTQREIKQKKCAPLLGD